MQELPNDIEGLMVPPGFPWRVIVIAMAIAALLAFCVYLWRRFRRGRGGLTPVERVLTRREQMDLALKDLAMLRAAVADVHCNMIATALSVSVLVRKLIEWNGLLQAPFLTGEELDMRWHAAPPLSVQDKIAVIGFVAALDRIKFAGQQANVAQLVEQIQMVETLTRRLYEVEVKREDVAHA